MFWAIVAAIMFVIVGIPVIIQLMVFTYAYGILLPVAALNMLIEKLPEKHRSKAWYLIWYGFIVCVMIIIIYIREGYY